MSVGGVNVIPIISLPAQLYHIRILEPGPGSSPIQPSIHPASRPPSGQATTSTIAGKTFTYVRICICIIYLMQARTMPEYNSRSRYVLQVP